MTHLTSRGERTVAAAPGAVVKPDGVLTWYANEHEVTISDLLRTAEAGIFDGDPLCILVDLRPPRGNGGIAHVWTELIEALGTIGDIGGGVIILHTAYDKVRGARRKRSETLASSVDTAAGWLADFIESHNDRWEERGARDPSSFLRSILRARSLDSKGLRKMLRIDDLADAAKFLDVFGYDYQPSSKRHVLSTDKRRLELRRQVLERFVGYDPATWKS